MTRILIVEDEKETADALEKYLSLSGYDTIVAENGHQAVTKARSTRPDVIIMDVKLPILGGMEACFLIKQQPEMKDVAIIMLTSLCGLDDINKCFAVGANCYMNKPVDPERLIAKVRKIANN